MGSAYVRQKENPLCAAWPELNLATSNSPANNTLFPLIYQPTIFCCIQQHRKKHTLAYVYLQIAFCYRCHMNRSIQLYVGEQVWQKNVMYLLAQEKYHSVTFAPNKMFFFQCTIWFYPACASLRLVTSPSQKSAGSTWPPALEGVLRFLEFPLEPSLNMMLTQIQARFFFVRMVEWHGRWSRILTFSNDPTCAMLSVWMVDVLCRYLSVWMVEVLCRYLGLLCNYGFFLMMLTLSVLPKVMLSMGPSIII